MKKEHHIATETPHVIFPIVVRFTHADVDVALAERMSRGEGVVPPCLLGDEPIPVDEDKLENTPTVPSVDFCLSWLAGYVNRSNMEMENSKWEKDYSKPSFLRTVRPGFEVRDWPDAVTELEELGIEVIGWDGLIQGQCSLTCQCPADHYSKELAFKAHHIVQDVFEKYVRYHK